MSCPACPADEPSRLIEEHVDRISGNRYRICACPRCGAVFSEPRQAVGPDWYEKAAPIRDRETRPDPSRDWRFRTFLDEGLPPGRLLDVGCGDGRFLTLALRRGFRCSGFDYERRMIELARAKGLEDVEAAEFAHYCAKRADGEFDCITLFDVLEHTPEPAWFLGLLTRLLKVGGHLAITLPNAERPLPWGREEHDFPPHHFTRWSAAALRGFLERHGYAVVRQDAGRLKLSYLADHFFFYAVMPRLLAPAKALLFGRQAQGTITELYRDRPAGGALSDKLRRQKLVNALKAACGPLTYAVAIALYVRYRLASPRCGDCLYTLARRTR